ncbi:MAG: GNAT family N-acetyltransferase [Rhizobacter sp.]|nr:GNAT family N-acetyltransferase [Rhizobacter sp.]
MDIALESPDQPEVIALIAELDAYQESLYPPESRHPLHIAALTKPNVVFAVARDAAGQALGCGAVVLSPAFGEIKRMYVHPQHRGQGIAASLLARLEAEAFAVGCTLLKLETGPLQPEALALYARSGYERCGPFGKYAGDPLSVFMRKRLGEAAPAR